MYTNTCIYTCVHVYINIKFICSKIDIYIPKLRLDSRKSLSFMNISNVTDSHCVVGCFPVTSIVKD